MEDSLVAVWLQWDGVSRAAMQQCYAELASSAGMLAVLGACDNNNGIGISSKLLLLDYFKYSPYLHSL